ncbi:hypothetical protein CANARDRAFT_24052 [[Candida] arabinofermentans NRRL YB-2248]|uniref:Zn(2)-C6 fungal-type domain-containing protein n=1 Tax=[Candida] arabinofermentans NRRL YB-2248 TaxID=983967 RepID=A0A1E4SXR3_9ASCO|nr:hypothetical protein CANARDRAFT_24052 [[Candida] arabinofermentans NRRL YB-2248]
MTNSLTSSPSHLSPEHHSEYHSRQSLKKKRVGKACDSCRLKKTKCSGKQPCEKCKVDNKICIYTERKKSKDKVYSYEYVELIEKRLSLVNKSLIKLCEIVKLDQKSELENFVANLKYTEQTSDETTPISINQAISLLIGGTPDDMDAYYDDATDDHLDSVAMNNSDMPLPNNDSSTTTQNSTNESHRSSSSSSSSISKQKRKYRLKKDRSTLSTDYNVILSSPESITPKSDEQFSPLQNTSTNETSMDSLFGHQQQQQQVKLEDAEILPDIKEEDRDFELSSPISPITGQTLNRNSFIDPKSQLKTEDDDMILGDIQSLGLNPVVDLGPFQSGAQIATAAMNGYLYGAASQSMNSNQGPTTPIATLIEPTKATSITSDSYSTNGFPSMPDFELGLGGDSSYSSATNLNSPSSLMGASPPINNYDAAFSSFGMIPSSLPHSSSASMNLMFPEQSNGGDSYSEFLNAVEPPTNLHRSGSLNSQDKFGKKLHGSSSSMHGGHHSYSHHPHPYRTASVCSTNGGVNVLPRTKSNTSLIDSIPAPVPVPLASTKDDYSSVFVKDEFANMI